MVTFNAKRAVTDHEVTAVQAALQMQTKFSALKKRWVAFGYNDTPTLFNRIGVCSGPVRKAELGHSQYRYITVMGNAVNLAKHLCDLGDRTRNVIVISEGTKSKLAQGAIVKRITASAGTNAYELDPTTVSPRE
jgi:class 3 adenylate cyclase